jgi:Protein of unknown function VcgC/VcgE (DUF2780)
MTPCLFALVAVTQARGTDSRPEAAGKLAKELKVAPEQAPGGDGAIFSLAKSRLNPADFAKLAASVPGMDGFLTERRFRFCGGCESPFATVIRDQAIIFSRRTPVARMIETYGISAEQAAILAELSGSFQSERDVD